MTAGTFTAVLPTLVVDPVDYLLVDVATGRHLPGGTVHAEQLAHEHGLSCAEATAALDSAWELGLMSRRPGTSAGVVVWTPETTQLQLSRLARVMVAAVSAPCDTSGHRADVIDGEAGRLGAVEMFGLSVPCDLDLFLEVARALVGHSMPSVVDELIAPVAILFSVAAQRVHGLEFAAPQPVREEIVSALVHALMDGEVEVFAELVGDYVVAMSID